MKFYTLIIAFLLSSTYGSSQQVLGTWYGQLSLQGFKLNLVFHIAKDGEIFSSTLDSPDQRAFGIKTSKTIIHDTKIFIEILNLGAEFNGEYNNELISGIFQQNGQSFPLILSKDSTVIQTKQKIQEPKKPYPYREIEVTFPNKEAGISLSGTLTLPEKTGKYSAVILITGSGAQDRNEEILGHKPFLIIADYLTRNGIAVLRFDDRGFGKSTGSFANATTFDFAKDVESAFAFLSKQKEIDKKKIGLIGHSEGGLIAPIVASKNKKIDFIVLLAAPALRGDKLLLLQQEMIAKSMGEDENEIKKMLAINQKVFAEILNLTKENKSEIEIKVSQIIQNSIDNDTTFSLPRNVTKSKFIESQLRQLFNPWIVAFIKYDPLPALQKVKCPVLALNGTEDLQVPAGVNLDLIKKSLNEAGNLNVKTKSFEKMNHLFQECNKCTLEEYGELNQSFSPLVLEEISTWIKSVLYKK